MCPINMDQVMIDHNQLNSSYLPAVTRLMLFNAFLRSNRNNFFNFHLSAISNQWKAADGTQGGGGPRHFPQIWVCVIDLLAPWWNVNRKLIFVLPPFHSESIVYTTSELVVGGVAQRWGRRSLAGGLFLIYGWHVTTSLVKCPLWVNQPGQLILPSLWGR